MRLYLLPRWRHRDWLQAAGVAYGVVNEVADLSRHSQLWHVTVKMPSGSVDLPAQAAMFTGQQTGSTDVPTLGSSTESVRAEFAQD